jgi:hypothetical protein
MKRRQYAVTKKRRSKRGSVYWKIEHGSLKPDGTYSTAFRIIQSYRTEKDAREEWKYETHWTEHSNNNYSALVRGRQLVSGKIHEKCIEVRYSKEGDR